MNISRIFQYKYIRNQIWPWCKRRSRSTQIHHLNKPGMAYTINPKAIGPLLPDKKILFKKVLPCMSFMGMVAILTIKICANVTPLNIRSLHIKFEFNWFCGFWENCFSILIGLQYKRPWLKGQRSTLTWELIYNHCLNRFNISSENKDFGFNGIQKSIFKICPI